MNGQLPSVSGVRAAQRLLRLFVSKTPLYRSEGLSRAFDADVWIKNETVSPIASFKLRGALTELLRARNEQRVLAAVTSSTGNHGQGVAYAARLLRISAHIFLPVNANRTKRSAIEMLGATIHQTGNDIDEAKAAARDFAHAHDYTFIDDGEGHGVMEGAGTTALEIVETLDSIDSMFIPMGSGSLAAGSAAVVNELCPNTRVIAVQANASPAMVESFRARLPVERAANTTIADGLVCREPAELALRALLAFVDEADLVTEDDLLTGVHVLAAWAHVLVEPSGAAAFAAAWNRRHELNGRRVVLILTGANIEMMVLKHALLSSLPSFVGSNS